MSIVVNDEQFEDSTDEGDMFDEVSQKEVTSENTDALDDLEASIKDDIPEKFKGKETADVIKAYTELEKELGRKNNEVGELRKLTDDFLKQQLEVPTKETKASTIDLDDLLDNPNDVLNRAVDNNPRIAALEKQLLEAKIEKQRQGFESKHPDFQSILDSGDFRNWVSKSQVRQKMFLEANAAYDYATLDEVFSLYEELRGAAKAEAETKAQTKRKEALRDTSVEKGSTGEVTKKVYRRADLIRLKQTNPARYSDMSEEIMLAYQEGRVR